MALFYTLQDDFSDLIRQAKWSQFGTTTIPSQTNGKLNFLTTTTNGYGGYTSVAQYDLTGNYVTTQLVDAGDRSIASLEIYIVQLYDTGNVNSLFWYLIQSGAGSLRAYKRVASTNTQLNSTAYDSTLHKYFRIREDRGTVYFDYSADGTFWINFTSLANPFTPNLLSAEPSVGTFSNEASTTTVVFDNFNTTPKRFNNRGLRPHQFQPGTAR